MLKKAKTIVDEITHDGKTSSEKTLAIHDDLVDNIAYTANILFFCWRNNMCETSVKKITKIDRVEVLNDFLEVERKKYCITGFTIPFFEFREQHILWKHNYLLRTTEYLYNTKKRIPYLFYKYRLNNLQLKYGIHIPINTCDMGLKIMHIGPILINSKAQIGKNCSIHINTSIVAGGSNDGVPIMGDHIVIGVGAVILGDIKIADYIAIGANAVVNKSFSEENITIAGVPAKKISNTGRKEWNKKAFTIAIPDIP